MKGISVGISCFSYLVYGFRLNLLWQILRESPPNRSSRTKSSICHLSPDEKDECEHGGVHAANCRHCSCVSQITKYPYRVILGNKYDGTELFPHECRKTNEWSRETSVNYRLNISSGKWRTWKRSLGSALIPCESLSLIYASVIAIGCLLDCRFLTAAIHRARAGDEIFFGDFLLCVWVPLFVFVCLLVSARFVGAASS